MNEKLKKKVYFAIKLLQSIPQDGDIEVSYIGVFTEHYVNDEEGEVVKVRPCINAQIYVDLPKAVKGEV